MLDQIYNIGDCHILIALNKWSSNLKLNLEYCNKTDDNLYYTNQCDGEKNVITKYFQMGLMHLKWKIWMILYMYIIIIEDTDYMIQ